MYRTGKTHLWFCELVQEPGEEVVQFLIHDGFVGVHTDSGEDPSCLMSNEGVWSKEERQEERKVRRFILLRVLDEQFYPAAILLNIRMNFHQSIRPKN